MARPTVGCEPDPVTFSIVARDPSTGELGVAVQSHWFSVGSVCPWAEAGVGAVATQSFAEPAYGPRLLGLLRSGMAAPEALAGLVTADAGRDVRQVAVVDAAGRVAVHTGASCVASCGHRTGDEVSVQGNMLLRDEVWSSMLDAYEAAATDGQDLAGRLLAALDEAEANGGDARGRQSAALLVVGGAEEADVRVDDHEVPLVELRRLHQLQRASNALGRVQQGLLSGEVDAALTLFAEVQETYGANLEPTFWVAALLGALDRFDEAVPLLQAAVASNPGWVHLLRGIGVGDAMPLTTNQAERLIEAAGVG
jgi:uncharacterized Ntn-hydrolase superfamily protein